MDVGIEKKTSIALCTYNGERFIQEQLDSIAAQTILPFELIICDDVSSDSTRDILESFAATAAFPVKLHFNSTNLGYLKNFEKAISHCTGDIVALCDQDDRWRSDKIEILQKYFLDPKVGIVFSNAAIIDEEGNPNGQTLWDAVHFTPELQQSFKEGDAYKALYIRMIVSGCTMAFQRKWWNFIQAFPDDILFVHDAWIAFIVALLAEVVIIDDCLIDYRMHTSQSISLARKSASIRENISRSQNGEKDQYYKLQLNQFTAIGAFIHRFKNQISLEKCNYLLETMKQHELHLIARTDESHNRGRRCGRIFQELTSGRYHRFSNGFKSLFVDLLKKSP